MTNKTNEWTRFKTVLHLLVDFSSHSDLERSQVVMEDIGSVNYGVYDL